MTLLLHPRMFVFLSLNAICLIEMSSTPPPSLDKDLLYSHMGSINYYTDFVFGSWQVKSGLTDTEISVSTYT